MIITFSLTQRFSKAAGKRETAGAFRVDAASRTLRLQPVASPTCIAARAIRVHCPIRDSFPNSFTTFSLCSLNNSRNSSLTPVSTLNSYQLHSTEFNCTGHLCQQIRNIDSSEPREDKFFGRPYRQSSRDSLNSGAIKSLKNLLQTASMQQS